MARRLWLIVVGMLAVAGCSKGSTVVVPPSEVQPIPVYVTNHFALPVEIYAVGGGSVFRLGTVHPEMSSTFKLPKTITGGGAVQFQARVIQGNQQYQSGELLLSPGAIVDLEIAGVLFNSTATIRP